MKTKVLGVVGLFLVVFLGFSQDKSINIHKVNTQLKVDGVLDEAEWQGAEIAKNFVQSKPFDSLSAVSITEVKVVANDDFLYIGAVCYDTFPGEYIVQSLKRDFSFPRTDAFGVFLDPFQDGINGFSFAVNPYGAQREGLVAFGGIYGVSTSWDNKWYSSVKRHNDKWVVEMAIPFKTIRFNKENLNWRINFARNNQKVNETSTWFPVPRNFNVAHLAYMGDLKWDALPDKQGANLAVIPYVLGGVSRDNIKKETDYKGNIGFDAKIGVTEALNLDLTVNPDFSQVEVDQQVTNLDRFELRFPEKRQFFLENQDLFSDMGTANYQPFFSRRVGILPNSNGVQQQVPILFGARLSGKVTNKLRIGVFNAQTGESSEFKTAPQNYGMIVAQQKIWKRSTISAFAVNRQGFDSTDFSVTKGDFNTVGGLNFQYRSGDGKWASSVIGQRSFEKENKEDGWFGMAAAYYDTRNIKASVEHQYVGEGFRADAGFFRRIGVLRTKPFFEYKYYPKSKIINYIGPGLQYEGYNKVNYERVEGTSSAFVEVIQLNTAKWRLSGKDNYIQLQRSFDPSGKRTKPLAIGTEVRFKNARLEYQSDERKLLFFDGEVNAGEYYIGHRFNVKGSLRYRIMPYANFSVLYSYNKINLPSAYNSSEFNLISPKIEVTLRNNVFVTTFMQFNDQIDNVNLNARIQWRFKPVSDVFLVYTDNYFPEDFAQKNRALVLKITYWLNK